MRRLFPWLLLSTVLLAPRGAAQAPGEYPHLTLTNSQGASVPAAGGPFDSTGEFVAASGTVVRLDLTYQALGQPNTQVVWGLLLALGQTSFPETQLPPPLYTQPPFHLVFGPGLNALGEGTLQLPMPAALVDAEAYVQALTFDSTSFPNLQLSNGVHVRGTPPRFNAAFSFVRQSNGLSAVGFAGVGAADIDGDTLNTHPPLGSTPPPDTTPDAIGLPNGFRFRPILPNVPDAPVNPLAHPFTRLSKAISGDASVNVFAVDDASFFPPSGTIWVQNNLENPFSAKLTLNVNLPNLEQVSYTGKRIDPVTGQHEFTGCQRVRLGSTGNGAGYPHLVGELVFGDYTFATSSAAHARTRVCLDATNDELPHVVIPPFTANLGEGQVTLDLDLYMYELPATSQQGFMVLDRASRSWRLIEGSLITASSQRSWDPMVAIAPDRRSFLACQRVGGGPQGWSSNPDEVYMLRLDGLDWPASHSETWRITVANFPEPTQTDLATRGREIHMPSVAIIGPNGDNFVAYVGFDYKWKQSLLGNQTITGESFEGFWIREELIVRDYLEVPLVAPGSTKSPPAMPRAFITSSFPPLGTTQAVSRFDPVPFVPPPGNSMFLVAGLADASISVEDMYVIRNVSVLANGEPQRVIQNLSGFGVAGGTGEDTGGMRPLDAGGHGQGGRVALSPSGQQVAWLRTRSDNGDFIHVAATDGSDFSSVKAVYRNPANGRFLGGGAYLDDHIVYGLHFADEDNLVFALGRNAANDPLGETLANPNAFDLFRYDIPAKLMTNLSHTSGVAADFTTLGRIQPAGFMRSTDGRFLYVLRDGPMSGTSAALPAGSPVMNLLAVDLQTFQVLDVSGDEFGDASLVANLDLPAAECRAPVETAASMRFVEGWGVQDGMLYFSAHAAPDATAADKLVAVDTHAPFVAFEVAAPGPAGSHLSNVLPNPYSSSVVFARTNGNKPFAADQHPFMVDLDNFLYQRDLTPTFFQGGLPVGRVMDGSFHFIAPTSGAGDALLFTAGGSVLSGSFGVAQDTSSVYYPLVNLSDPLAEPIALLLPVLDTFNLGPGHRVYVTSAAASSHE